MHHETIIRRGIKPGVYDWFCTCGEFSINHDNPSLFADSHTQVANAHDQRLEETGQCIHGGYQKD